MKNAEPFSDSASVYVIIGNVCGLFACHVMMVAFEFLPTAPGEVGNFDRHAVVFNGNAGQFAQA